MPGDVPDGWSGALHGTVVLPRSGGETLTVEIQNGRVTAVSQSSITLKSNDGFTQDLRGDQLDDRRCPARRHRLGESR
jgi:hypothetical protein